MSNPRPAVIGADVPRVEGIDKVTGHVTFVDNIEPPGMLHGMIRRSQVPHGRIRRIDTSRARQLSGVYAVLTGEDLLRMDIDPYIGPAFKDQAPLAIGKVRYAGDPVAAVAAVDRDTAEEALDLIDVEVEELPAVFDVQDALRPDAPLVCERLVPAGTFADLIELLGGGDVPATSNACFQYKLRRGDVAEGLRRSDRVFEHTFSNPPTQHSDLEYHCSIAQWEASNRLQVWTATQSPSYVRIMLANMFRLPESRVRVRVPYLGGGFGSKLYMKLEPLAALLALVAGRPVKIRLTRNEEFFTITKHGLVAKLTTGVTRDGRLLARDCQIMWDTGAYADIGPRVTHKSGYTSAGPYQIPNVRIDSFSVYTNKPPAGAFRGFGIMQVCWAYESQMDIIAREMGWDPVEFRLKNVLREGDVQATGTVVHSLGLDQCVRAVADAVAWDYREASAPHPTGDGARHLVRGKGVACSMKAVITPSVSAATVLVHSDGSASVLSSSVEMGQGSDTALCQIVAEELGARLQDVAIVHPDTDVTPYDLITAGSRTTFHMGNAVRMAAIDARSQLWPTAAELLDAAPDDLTAQDGRVWARTASDRSLTHGQIMMARFGGRAGTIEGHGLFETHHGSTDLDTGQSDRVTAHWMCGATAAEVEVDTDTGQVRIVNLATAVDVGNAINPFACRQQIGGASVQGTGPALLEEMLFEAGQLTNPSFVDYKIPSFLDLPDRLQPLTVEDPHPDGPYGAKGIGEAGIFAIAPAIANAVADAVGARIPSLPITPEKVLRAIAPP
ncbi:MAG: molybdopterin-dependent oxidoreductase [Chloroflexi bacterium]|nr:molybdopterin-dependent oxidoreductase [Chloroflexota bacterium]